MKLVRKTSFIPSLQDVHTKYHFQELTRFQKKSPGFTWILETNYHRNSVNMMTTQKSQMSQKTETQTTRPLFSGNKKYTFCDEIILNLFKQQEESEGKAVIY